MIIKSTCLLSDETNFFWSIKFFTEFNRHAHSSIDRIRFYFDILFLNKKKVFI
jgi:hypothetical protein